MLTFYPRLYGFVLTFWIAGFLPLHSQSNDHLEAEVDIDGSQVAMEVTYTLPEPPSSDTLYFLLNPGFSVQEITAPGLRSYRPGPKAGRPFPFWTLVFDHAQNPGKPLDIHFTYSFDLREQNHLNSDWIELNADKMWVPNHNDLDNEFTYDIRINGWPESYSLVGHVDAKIRITDTLVQVIRTEPAAEVLLLGGKDVIKHQRSDSIVIYARTDVQDSVLQSIHTKIKHSIDLLNQAFGYPDPITSFTVVLRNTSLEEINYQFSRANLIVTGVEFDSYANLSHEVAHYWWSKADFIREPWLNESFANYSMYLVMEQYDSAAYERLLERYRKLSETAIPVNEASILTPEAYTSYYIKGSVLLKELEDRIGIEKMKAWLARLVENEKLTTTTVLHTLEQITDSPTRAYFEQLLDR